ncbi:MAG: uroporphyrinogen decarboxylase [Actinomycetota bacterium]
MQAESRVASRFIRACHKERVDVTPVWMMRQAGRSIPRYRKIRDRYSFLEIVTKPELMCEVTLLPMNDLEVDAAIMFADIMLPIASLGVEFDIVETIGPVIANPIRSDQAVSNLRADPLVETVPSVFEAIRLVRKELGGRAPLIGFSGAPFTLACYLIEGQASREFTAARAFMLQDEIAWHSLMQKLTTMVIEYLREQIDAGVQAVQLFDSWIGVLSRPNVERYVEPYMKQIFAALSLSGVPRISFGTGTPALLETMAEAGCDVVGVDWRTPLDEAWPRIGYERAIQGNLDPAALLAPHEVLRAAVGDVMRRAGGRAGHIFNLGHGVLPGTSLDAMKIVVDEVHSFDSEGSFA